jgi:hypothetical protein
MMLGRRRFFFESFPSEPPVFTRQEGQPTTVFLSATYLIHQTNMVMITVKDKCE